jgi:hypothetical protein
MSHALFEAISKNTYMSMIRLCISDMGVKHLDWFLNSMPNGKQRVSIEEECMKYHRLVKIKSSRYLLLSHKFPAHTKTKNQF